ncbi:MAG: PspA/IM30 family protein [Anaerolineales bacterium]|nr:PspA/IM30 family protein [Anaerolineales bacterium]
MTTLTEKVTVLITANLHALVDQALQRNSLAVVDQYLRQIDDQLLNLAEAAATVGGEAKSLERRLGELDRQTAEYDQAVDRLLAQGQEPAAAAAQGRLNGLRQLRETYQAQHDRQAQEYRQLAELRGRLETRQAALRQQRSELQALLDLARSKELVVRTLRSLDDLRGAGDSDIRRLAQSIYTRLDQADAAVELRGATLDEQIEQVLDQRAIAAQLAERRERLRLAAN